MDYRCSYKPCAKPFGKSHASQNGNLGMYCNIECKKADLEAFFAGSANIDGIMAGVLGTIENPHIHIHLSITLAAGGRSEHATYAVHPALMPIIQKFLGTMASSSVRLGWIDGDGEYRGT